MYKTDYHAAYIDDDESTKMPSSSSGDGDGNSHHSTVMADSNVLRLIRRYDPVAANNVGIRSRRSLENTRSASHATTSKPIPSLSSNISSSSCSYLPQQTSYPLQEDIRSIRHSLTPRLQRQKSIHEPDLLPESNETKTSIQPILKYTPPTSRAALNIQPKKTEPLSIEIEPHVPSIAAVNESSIPYQPLITTGTKRVCAAISKSEWNLRLQQDPPFPILSPSTPPTESASPPKTMDQPPPPPPSREKESYRPLFNRSKSTMEVHSQNDQDHEMDDFDENSAPINSGSCVGKLKQLFNTKSSTSPSNASLNKQNRMDSLDSSLNRRLHTHGTNQNTSDVPSSPIIFNQQIPHQTQSTSNGNLLTKPTTIVQDVTPTTASPLLKRPILRSQKTLDSTESLNRLNQNQTMPTSDLAYDVYHFRRLNDPEPITPATRLRNIAKVEPYSINTNMVRPLYQSSSLSQPTSTIVSSKAHTIPNSTGNTPTNSSTSSSAASLGGTIRHPNIRHSDFLIPNPSYSSAPPPPPPPTSLHVTQSLSNSSSYATPPPPPLSTSILLSESLSQGSANRLPSNTSLHNGRSTGLIHSTNNSPPKYQSTTQGDFYPGKRTYSPSTYHNGHGSSMNNSLYTKFDNNPAPSSYHYRPKEFASSNIPTNSPLLNNGRPSSQGQMRSRPVEQQPHDDRMAGGGQQHQSRRRFQRRKQMKRSKSADLYQDLSATSSRNPNTNNYLYDSNRHHESNRSQQSIGRDLPGGGGDGHYSSSSSSTSIGDIERTNRAALLRYKSLDSVTFNNKKSNLNGKPTNRKQLSKSIHMDFDSDDSVCGIPKPRKTHGR